MAFNPNGVYLSCTDTLGNVYAWQNGMFYDKYGDSFSVLPTSNRGQLIPSPLPFSQSGVASSVTGTTSETTLASITIPGGMMGPNGSIRVRFEFSNTNNANNKTYRMYYGGLSGYNFFAQIVTTSATGIVDRGFRNQNSISVQRSPGVGLTGPGATGGTMTTGSINSSLDQQFVITGQLANGADTFTLEGYTLEVLSA